MKVYQKLGQLSKVWKIKDENARRDRLDDLDKLIHEKFPSGSGFNSGTKLVTILSNKVVLQADFHHMDEHGGYDGWSHHQVIVTPDLEHGFDIRITGRDKNGIKEYIGETFHQVLNEEV